MRPRQPVDAPRATPPRVSLLTAATVIENGDRWQMGYGYAPESCGVGGGFNPCTNDQDFREEIPDHEPEVAVEPVGIWVGDKCSTIGADGRDLEGRIRRLLVARQAALIEAELWTGDLAQAFAAAGFEEEYGDNPRLASPASDVVTAGATSIVGAVACLEAALADCGVGQGFIHVPAQVATYLTANNLVRREGAVLLTIARDTVVVPGGGYDGSGPDGQPADVDATWIYATGPVTVRLGPIDVHGVGPDTVDRRSNDALALALRLAGVSFDPCCHFAAQTELDPCGIGGAGS